MTATRSNEMCFGLVLLLEAAEYHSMNMVTPPCIKKRGATTPLCPPPRPVKPSNPKALVSSSLSTNNKRIKLGINPLSSSNTFNFSPIKKARKSSKCSGGSIHRMWEPADECELATSSARRSVSSNVMKATEPHNTKLADGDTKTFLLYDHNDDKHINALPNIVRRDIWEGFVVDHADSMDVSSDKVPNARQSARIARYDGTIGFRCRFCKNAPIAKRAERSVVYPRSLERIYLANIRFQRDHIGQCMFIPSEMKETYARLKNSKGVSRGRKQYWVTSATQRGLCNGENGIVISSGIKCAN